MPSSLHEGIVALVREKPPLAADGRSLRAIAAMLTIEGHASRKRSPFFAAQAGRMLDGQRAAA
jgi:hypothetical protein